MTEIARQYELVLMLDPEVEESAREQLVTETRTSIESAGDLKNEDTWGVRQLAYEINRKNEADYRIFRFEGPVTLLESLDHTLKITDGVMRFRVFKVDPEDPVLPAPPAVSVVMAPTGDDDDRRGGRGGRYRD